MSKFCVLKKWGHVVARVECAKKRLVKDVAKNGASEHTMSGFAGYTKDYEIPFK